MPNIFFAKPADYVKATQRVYHAGDTASFIELPVVTVDFPFWLLAVLSMEGDLPVRLFPWGEMEGPVGKLKEGGRRFTAGPSFIFTERSLSAVGPLLVLLIGLAARIAALFVLAIAIALLMLALTRRLSLRVVLLLLRIAGSCSHP